MKLEEEIRSKFRSEYQKVRLNIFFTNNYLLSGFQDLVNSYGITATQYNVLRILRGQHPKTASIGLIKERMLDKNSDISRIVDRLFKKKLVKRVESSCDRRQKEISISNDGLSMLSKMDTCEAKLDKLVANLSDTEVQLLNDLLDKIRD